MSVKDKYERFNVMVDGFEYQVFHMPVYDGSVSYFEFWHWKDGEAVELDCPLSESGYMQMSFKPSYVKKYGSEEAGAIEAIKYLQSVSRYEGRKVRRIEADAAAAQFSLFA